MTEEETNNSVDDSIKDFNKLSIQVSLNGLSFCVLDTITNTILSTDRIVFEEERTPYGMQKGLVALFKKHHISQKEFSEVIVIHRNNLFSLVPKPLFDTEEMPNYLKFNTKILAGDHIVHDEIEGSDVVNVYVPFVNINNYIYEIFGEFEFRHSSSVIIQTLLNGNNKEPNCYVHVLENHMDITIIDQKRLLFHNSFTYETKEDFIYYLLFTLEQLKLDTETVKLKLFGTIEEGDTIYTICYKYVKHISIFVPTKNIYPLIGVKDESIDFTILNSL